MARSIRLVALSLACTAVAPVAARAPVERVQAGHPGDALRSRLGIVLPSADTMIVIHGVATHHTKTEWSIVAWRSKSGRWTVERAGEEGPGLLPIATRPIPASTSSLSTSDAKTLDRLLKDRAVFRDKVAGGEYTVGGYASAMEIVTPRRTRRIDWIGALSGKPGQIADLVIGTE